MRRKKIKTKNKAIILVVILIIAILAFADYLWQKDLKNTADQKNQIIASSNTPLMPAPKSNTASTEIITVSTTTPKIQPLSFKTDAPKISAVRELDGVFNYQAAELKARADNCGTSYSESHFENLVAKFKQSPRIFYTFKYRGANASNSDESVYSVTVLSNKAGYKTIEEFKKDFGLCGSGGVDNPFMLNENWLLFVSSCGSGFDDGSGRINSCEAARKIIEPSLKLK
jgi:hypothetical protein